MPDNENSTTHTMTVRSTNGSTQVLKEIQTSVAITVLNELRKGNPAIVTFVAKEPGGDDLACTTVVYPGHIFSIEVRPGLPQPPQP